MWSADLVAVCVYGVVDPAPLRAQSDCSSCHETGQKQAKSGHGALTCDTCHENHDKYPHPANTPKPACASCHETEGKDHDRSVHGITVKKGDAAADCSICHGGAHELPCPKSTEFRAAMADTCAMCHSAVVGQYKVSVHGAAVARGVTEAPLCSDCHGEHSIQKHNDKTSPGSAGRIWAGRFAPPTATLKKPSIGQWWGVRL